MLDIFIKIFDAIFPPLDYVKELRYENTSNFKRHYLPHQTMECVALSDYKNPFIKSAVTANKFHDYQKASNLLSTLIECWLAEQSANHFIFVPIPLSRSRHQSRGYNQISRVLEKINSPNVVIEDFLIRKIDTKPQTSLKKTERLKNLVDAFLVDEDKLKNYSDQKIVIVDDVITTGATMLSAKSILITSLPKECEVICLALAH